MALLIPASMGSTALKPGLKLTSQNTPRAPVLVTEDETLWDIICEVTTGFVNIDVCTGTFFVRVHDHLSDKNPNELQNIDMNSGVNNLVEQCSYISPGSTTAKAQVEWPQNAYSFNAVGRWTCKTKAQAGYQILVTNKCLSVWNLEFIQCWR